MALDLGTLVAKVTVDDGDFDKKADGWSTKGAAIGSAFGNLAADGISTALGALQGYVDEAMTASDATDKFKKTLEFAGLDTSQIDAMTASTQAYADATTYSLGDIQSITAQLASNGVNGPDALAKALGNLNAIAGGNAETFGRVGSVLTQTTGAGKLTTENWNQLAEAIPGASGKLMQALQEAGAYTGDFRDQMSKGEITADEFNAAIQKIGTDPIAVEAAASTKTFEGAAGNLAATIQSKLVTALDFIKPAITGFQDALSWFIGNSGLFIPVITGIGVAVLTVFAPAIWAAIAATAAWTVALLANPMTWIVLGIVALVAAIVWLIQNWDTAVAWISEVWGGFLGWMTSVIDGFVGWWNGVWAAVGKWISDVWSGFTSWVQGIWQAFITGITVAVATFVNGWNSTWSAVGKFISDVWNGFIGFVSGAWSGFVNWIMGVLSGYVGFWIGIWNSVRDGIVSIWNGIIGWFEGIPATIKGIFDGAVSWLFDIGRNVVEGFWNGLKSIWDSVSKWFQDTFGGVVDLVAGIFGIHSPSRVFRDFGVNIGQGLIEGLQSMGPAVDDAFIDLNHVPSDTGFNSAWSSGTVDARTSNKTVIYNAAPNASFEAEEELIAALGSPRVRD